MWTQKLLVIKCLLCEQQRGSFHWTTAQRTAEGIPGLQPLGQSPHAAGSGPWSHKALAPLLLAVSLWAFLFCQPVSPCPRVPIHERRKPQTTEANSAKLKDASLPWVLSFALRLFVHSCPANPGGLRGPEVGAGAHAFNADKSDVWKSKGFSPRFVVIPDLSRKIGRHNHGDSTFVPSDNSWSHTFSKTSCGAAVSQTSKCLWGSWQFV